MYLTSNHYIQDSNTHVYDSHWHMTIWHSRVSEWQGVQCAMGPLCYILSIGNFMIHITHSHTHTHDGWLKIGGRNYIRIVNNDIDDREWETEGSGNEFNFMAVGVLSIPWTSTCTEHTYEYVEPLRNCLRTKVVKLSIDQRSQSSIRATKYGSLHLQVTTESFDDCRWL